MTTIAELCAQTPGVSDGQPVQFSDGGGGWRHVVELADPSAGASVVWHDITPFWCGYSYTRGAEQYQGRYRASVANIELCTDTDALAPWNSDTSDTFGVHVELGPGLLIRSGFARVAGGVVVDWNPRFTLKVESWSDASYSLGQIRRHLVVARDVLTGFVNMPLPASDEENWSERIFRFLTDTGAPYGSLIYGAQYESDTTTPILLLPARPAASSAVNELDATCDPTGLVWYTSRIGQLVVRPRVDDTFHADAFTAGATGNEWPEPERVWFAWWACQDPDPTAAAYAQDNRVEPFGLDRTERGVINHVKITYPAGGFDDDDPISIQRFDRHTFQASWIAANDTVAAAMLGSRAFATVEARPLTAGHDMPGYFTGADRVDYLHPVGIEHRNNDTGLVATALGWLRHAVENCYPLGCDVVWSQTFTVDVYQVDSEQGLLPVEDLAVVDVGTGSAELSWTNPTQVITPTNTQIRLAGSPVWTTVAYPITGVVWSGLNPATGYTFQVRLIRIEDGLITHYSPLRQITFVTEPSPGPVVDDGTVTFPDPGECGEIDWELQESTDPDDWANPLIPEYAVVDSGTLTDPPWTVDISGYTFDPARLYRIRSDACGEITFSNLFVGACSEPAILGTAPYDDADLIAYWPAICPEDIVVESISETAAAHGPSWDGFVLDAASSVVLIANGDGIVANGPSPAAVTAVTDDTTLAARVLLSTQPDAPLTLFATAGLAIEALADGGNWKVRGKAIEAGAGVTTITSGSLELDFGAWYDVAIVHAETAGDLMLYVDGTEVASALGTVGARTNPGTVDIGVSDNGLITNCAMWDRVLAPEELPGFVPVLTVTINKAIGQADPASTSPIEFTIVFSEAVTGFLPSEVTLSGTAGATSTSLVGTGPTYTAQVSGMTGSGTVIASIAAGVCTATATGAPNEASTSVDNSVDYDAFSPITGVAWHAAYWADGPEMLALAYSNGASVTTWPDEVGTEDLTGSTVPVMVTSDSSFNNHRSVQWVNDATRFVQITNINHPATQAQPFTYVVIGKMDTLPTTPPSNDQVWMDGVGSFDQRIGIDDGVDWVYYAGGTARLGGTPDTSPHHILAYFNGASSRLEIDGSTLLSGASPGTDSHDGVRLGYHASGATDQHRLNGRLVFAGVYYGDAESDSGWSAFKAWVGTFYGITVA